MTRKKRNKNLGYADTYERKRKYSIEEVWGLWVDSHAVYEQTGEWPRISLDDGITLTMKSDRYDNFFINGTNCVACGIKGEYFWLETFKKGKDRNNMWHFNLYGTDADGNEMMLTKDYIVPKSRGGRNYIGNYRTMCERCNHNKAAGVQ